MRFIYLSVLVLLFIGCTNNKTVIYQDSDILTDSVLSYINVLEKNLFVASKASIVSSESEAEALREYIFRGEDIDTIVINGSINFIRKGLDTSLTKRIGLSYYKLNNGAYMKETWSTIPAIYYKPTILLNK